MYRLPLMLSIVLLPGVVRAEMWSASWNPPNVQVGLSGQGDGFQYPTAPGIPGAMMSLQFDFDWGANTMRYDLFSLDCPNLTGRGWRNWTIGPGQTEQVVTTLHFDPFTVETQVDVLTHLVPTTGGAYNIEGGTAVLDGPRQFTGTYTIEGPTEKATGQFAWTPTGGPAVGYSRLLTASYPHEMTLQGEATATWSGSGANLISEIVDGHQIDVGISSVTFAMRFPPICPGTPVPEPGTLVLLLTGAFGVLLLVWRRRRKV